MARVRDLRKGVGCSSHIHRSGQLLGHSDSRFDAQEVQMRMLFSQSKRLCLASIFTDCLSPIDQNLHLPSQLDFIIDQSDLFTRLKRGKTNVGTSVTSECIPQCTITAAAHFSLHREIYLCQLVRFQFCKRLIGIRALRFILSFEALRKATCAVFTSTPTFASFGPTFGCFDGQSH